jgi:hypothetical protein
MPLSTLMDSGIVIFLDGFLCLDQSGYEVVEIGWVDVADGDDARSGVVAEWRVKPARVVYGHFYFSMSEALLRAESGSGSGPVHNRRFPLLDSPAA